MGLFGNKKKGNESLRTLTEKEIQARLYGTFRNPQATASDIPLVAPPVAKGPSNGSHAPDVPPAVPGRPAIKITKSDSWTTRSVPDSESEKDLFKMSESVQDSGLSTKVQPGDTIPSLPGSKPGKAAFRFAKVPAEKTSKPVNISRGLPVGQWVRTAGNFLKALALKILAVLGWVLRALFRLVLAIDFRRPLVRRLAYGVGIVAVLAFLFASIQSLNGKREAAMKNPPKPVAKKIQPAAAKAKPEKAKPVESSQKPAEVKKAVEAKKAGAFAKEGKASAVPPSQSESKTPVAVKAPQAVGARSAAATAPSPGGPYSIQIATFAAREDAQRLSDTLKVEQMEAFIKPLNRPGGRVYYCVFAGHYPSAAEGEKMLEEFKKKDVAKPFQDAFVRSLPAA